MALFTGCAAEPEHEHEPPIVEFECNVEVLFKERCGGSACHDPGDSTAAGLDLVSPGVEERVAGMPGNSCTGILANPADPTGSLLYQKVAGTPTCGARMPINGEPLTDDEQLCLRDWISGLVPATAEEDEGDDCPACLCEPDAVEDCYNGLPDTANVGICVSGMHTCGPDGMSWGTCEGEVVPRGENCFTPDDENCDGSTPECSEVWSIGFGNELPQGMRSVAVDSQGNVISLGDFEGTVSFGGDPLQATLDKADLVVAKHDRYGNPVWSQRHGDNSNQYAAKLIVDSQDSVIVLARIYGHIDFGEDLLDSQGQGDIAIFKLDRDGNYLWSHIYGDPDPDRAERMVVDSNDDVILTGAFTTAIDFGGGPLVSSGARDAFVVKLDGATGAHIFSQRIGGVGDDYGFGVDVDANDNILVGGRFHDLLEIDTDLTSAGGSDIYLAKLTPGGAVLWSRTFGGTGDDGLHDLKIAPQSGNIVLLGYMSETVDFGGGPLVSAGMRDIFVAALDADGGHRWSANYGDATDQFTNSSETSTWMTLDIESSGAIVFGGALQGTIAIDEGVVLSANGTDPDAFFVRLDGNDGSFLAGDRFGTTSSEVPLDVDVTDTGHLLMAGRAFGTKIDFGVAGTISLHGSSDGFIVKLPLGG